MRNTFVCSRCNHILPLKPTGGTGYAFWPDNTKVCYECCGKLDRATMLQTGHSKHLPLYLSPTEVTNWPGTLRFPIIFQRKTRHNIGGTCNHAWFIGPDNKIWYGRQIGRYTQIIHCHRTKLAHL